MRYTLKVPTPSGRLVPFPIEASDARDLRRQARVLFSHVWDRIVWPDGIRPVTACVRIHRAVRRGVRRG